MQCLVRLHPPLEQTGLKSSWHVCWENKQTKTIKKTVVFCFAVVSDDVMYVLSCCKKFKFFILKDVWFWIHLMKITSSCTSNQRKQTWNNRSQLKANFLIICNHNTTGHIPSQVKESCETLFPECLVKLTRSTPHAFNLNTRQINSVLKYFNFHFLGWVNCLQ